VLDVQSLMIATTLANALLAAVLLSFWQTERTYPGLLRITGHLLLMAISFLLLALRGVITDLVSVVAANALIVLSIVLLFDGLMQFYEGRSISTWYYLLPVVTAGGFIPLRYVWDLPVGRVIFFSVVVGVLLLSAACRIARNRHQEGALPLFLAGTMALGAVVIGARTVVWVLQPGATGVLNSSQVNVLFQLVQLALSVTVPAIFLLSTVRRVNRELRSSQLDLRSLAGRYDLAITAAEMGVWDLDLVERRLIWDDRMYDLWQTTPETSGDLFSTWLMRVVPDDRERVQAGIRHATQTGGVFDLEFRLGRKDGEPRTVHAQARLFRDPSGDARRLVGVMFDVTTARRTEDALRSAVKKLNLLSSITRHDIQNQLTALVGCLDLGEEEAMDRPGLLQTLVLERRIVGRIARQIAFTREYEDLGIHSPVWQNLGEVAAKAIRDAPVTAVCVQPNLDRIEVWADPMLPRVFYNLLENAARHAGLVPRISIVCRRGKGHIVVSVEDDGMGIPVAEKERIFDRGVGKNTGFGLFMSREILGLTGIAIAETGVAGAGARFELSVPREVYRIRPAAEGKGSGSTAGRGVGSTEARRHPDGEDEGRSSSDSENGLSVPDPHDVSNHPTQADDAFSPVPGQGSPGTGCGYLGSGRFRTRSN